MDKYLFCIGSLAFAENWVILSSQLDKHHNSTQQKTQKPASPQFSQVSASSHLIMNPHLAAHHYDPPTISYIILGVFMLAFHPLAHGKQIYAL